MTAMIQSQAPVMSTGAVCLYLALITGATTQLLEPSPQGKLRSLRYI